LPHLLASSCEGDEDGEDEIVLLTGMTKALAPPAKIESATVVENFIIVFWLFEGTNDDRHDVDFDLEVRGSLF
jgi:hypothetical protein